MQIEYQLSLAHPKSHEFELCLKIACEASQDLRLTLPAWIPGSYMIRDFARNIRDLQVLEDGQRVQLEKLDKQTWLAPAVQGRLEVRYRVYALDESVRSAYFDDTRAYFNGTSLFLRVLGREDCPHRLSLLRPAFPGADKWEVATTLPAIDTDAQGFGEYQAAGYTQLIDHPVEIGCLRKTAFDVRGVPHKMVFVDAEGAEIDRIPGDLQPICEEHVAMFGELPVSAYLFQTLATRDAYGGLEHRDSSSLICSRSDLPWAGTRGISKGYRRYLALCSHEYFHLWNVKRIRPEIFVNTDLSRESHTRLLWAFEGITSYYDELALPRSGVLPHDDYLDMLAPSLTRYYRNSGRQRQSVAESSFDAWTKFYKQDESAPNAIVSYYNKGALVAFGLDHLMRLESGDRLTLDDLMRHLWQHFGVRGVGLPEWGIEEALAQLLGHSVDDFFARYIYGVEELPLSEWFADFGVGLRRRPGKSLEDQGGFIDRPGEEDGPWVSLGARTTASDGLVKVEQVYSGGAAEQAGVTPGDLLLAVNGERCTQDDLSELLGRYAVGDSVRLSLFRRDRLHELILPILASPHDTVDLYWLDDAQLGNAVKQRRMRWLASSRQVLHA